jgi:hypothetical protein
LFLFLFVCGGRIGMHFLLFFMLCLYNQALKFSSLK